MLSQNYIVDQIYDLARRTTFNRTSNAYVFECPVCGEGTSMGKKRRGSYSMQLNIFGCFNCNKHWSPLEWIRLVSGKSYKEIYKDNFAYSDTINDVFRDQPTRPVVENTYSLPTDSINLSDARQVDYYSKNKHVRCALEYISKRRLDTAINKARTYYISLNDTVHRNRLIIPFFDTDNKILFYQSRALTPEAENVSRYLSKSNAAMSLYGVDKVNTDLPYIFLFEGPIDSMFVRNGVGVGGLHLKEYQKAQLTKYFCHEQIWILDNQLNNEQVLNQYYALIETGQRVFVWPETLKEYKDLNDVCVATQTDDVSHTLFTEYSYTGDTAIRQIERALLTT